LQQEEYRTQQLPATVVAGNFFGLIWRQAMIGKNAALWRAHGKTHSHLGGLACKKTPDANATIEPPG
jgi:hypothetical protein